MNIRRIKLLKGLQLADCYKYNDRAEVSILIGADYYWKVVSGQIRRITDKLVASETIFGWCLQGLCNDNSYDEAIVTNLVIDESVISEQLKQFWELENLGVGPNDIITDNSLDQEVLRLFESNISFNDGRYEVELPWKTDAKHLLENNKETAYGRYKRLNMKFKANPLLFSNYRKIIEEYLEEGIIESVLVNNDSEIKHPIFYLPHRAVIRTDKSSSQLRIVFDASCHDKGKVSLNNCLHTGPNLNPDVLELILKFRENPVAFIADVKQAFLQIKLNEEDRDVTRFLWSSNVTIDNLEDLKVFRFTRVLFGVKSSPFLLAGTIKHHLRKYRESNTDAYKLLNEAMYVDDLIGGQANIDEAYRISIECVNIFKDAGMILRKWQTNSRELRSRWTKLGIYEEEAPEVIMQKVLPLKVLGVAWDTEEDVCYFNTSKLTNILSKRNDCKRFVLQIASSIFDPVGFLSPYTIRIKCLIQELWSSGLGWDDRLTDQLKKRWNDWCDEIFELNRLKIPRYYLIESSEKIKTFELHCFSDASKKAYGTVIYLRVITSSEKIITSFVASKTRVAPLKTLSLPRLELMGALLAARLGCRIAECLKYKLSRHFWVDSSIVYHWIRNTSNRFKPFVRNRIEEIQKITQPVDWSYCPGKDNPADFTSRGMTVSNLLKNEVWWNGPSWLRRQKTFWPKLTNNENRFKEEELEIKSNTNNAFQFNCVLQDIKNFMNILEFSSLFRLKRITAWILRFVFNCNNKDTKRRGPLSAEELQVAEQFWIKNIQEESYGPEISDLMAGNIVEHKSSIFTLRPFLDSERILRVGGRLDSSEYDQDEKHPILLPRNNKFTELLILKEHNQMMHCGVAGTFAQVRRRFWISKGRQFIKKVIKRCLICNKYAARSIQQIPGQLPKDRIHESPPFHICGIDFAGPVYVKEAAGSTKSYIALFTCAVTRAIHLELITDLTTDKFILAFRRFIARRGICHTIYSDNAKTFKRAEKELEKIISILRSQNIQDFIAKKGIHWKYIMERAPWWGGFYERLVKSVKTCLRKILGRALLSFEELTTTISEVESIINSRPLTYLYSELNEPEPLTPAHFLAGRDSVFIPPINLKTALESSSAKELNKRRLYRQRLLNQFWSRWKNQYIMILRSAHHLTGTQKPVEIKNKDVVLIEGKDKSKMLWELGVIEEVFYGRDGLIRSCKVRTAKTTLRRPVQLLYPLEMVSETD